MRPAYGFGLISNDSTLSVWGFGITTLTVGVVSQVIIID